MCILSDSAILQAIKERKIIIDPFDREKLGPNSYDLRIGNKLMTHIINAEYPHIDPRREHPMATHIIPEDGLVLHPNECYLGATIEVAGSDYHVPMIETKSGVARCTLSAHTSAGFGDVGWRRQWTLEITVVKPYVVRPGDELCQVYFQTVEGQILQPYKGKHGRHTNVDGPTPSQIFRQFEGKS